jgi:hypothetical protein
MRVTQSSLERLVGDRRTRQRGQDIPAGSNRSPFQYPFCHGDRVALESEDEGLSAEALAEMQRRTLNGIMVLNREGFGQGTVNLDQAATPP